MKSIPFLIIGAGHIGKRHASMVVEHPEANLLGFIEIDPNKHAGIQQQFPNTPVFSTIEDAIQSCPTAEVLNVCTPNGLHTQHAIEGLQHGLHVVVEKPMGLKRADCEALIYEALHRSKQVFMVMQNRFSPPSKWLKSVIDSGVLGKLYKINVNCYWNRGDDYYNVSPWKGTLELDGGPLFTQFSHFIDIMYWIFGDIENISARFQNFNHTHNTEFEDSGSVQFDFVQGGLGSLQYSTSVAHTNFESSITVIAEKGTIKVGGQYMDQIEYCDIQDYTMPELEAALPPNDYGSYKGSAANHHFIIENVVNTLLERDRITTNALEGLKIVDIIERIYSHRKL